jgi:exopolysaccharide biosynthesis polyprenyl glycosylphosphotransferase
MAPLVLSSPPLLVVVFAVIPALFLSYAAHGIFSVAGRATAGVTARRLVLAAAVGSLAVMAAGGALALGFGARLRPGTLIVGFGAAGLTFCAAVAVRRIALRVGLLSRRILFVGSEAQGTDLAREVNRRGDLTLVGIETIAPPRDLERDALRARILQARPTTLVLSTEAVRHEEVVAIATELHAFGVRVRLLNDFYETQFSKIPVSELSRAWFLFDVAEIHRLHLYGRVKRWFETVVAALLLILALPLMIATAVAVKLSGPGRVFFRQERVGKNGCRVVITKFRTMTTCGDTAVWATDDVTKITAIGRFLRRYRLDEIPQLWHVIRGDLSLVGPRPEQPSLVDHLAERIEFYGARHCVRPGLTGWAQVNHGYCGSVEATIEKLQYDFFYIRHQSLRFDLLILAATIRTILSGAGT